MNSAKLLKHPAIVRVLPFVWIGFLGWLVFFHRLDATGLLDETEPLFAEAARQMTVTGDWITPYFNGVTRFDKPPLIYWYMAIAYQTFGTTAWAARLPSAIAATLLIGICFYVLQVVAKNLDGKNRIKDSVASPNLLPYLGSAIVALNLEMLFFGRLGYSDMLLNLCFGGSLLAFFMGYVQPLDRIKTRWYFVFYSLMALAVLTKGPVGVVLPSAIVLIFLFCVRNLRAGLREMKVMGGAIVFVLITLPWYVLVYLANGSAFVNSFFGMHNVERFTSVVNQHSGPWYFHLLIVLIGFLPWSLTLPAAIASVVQRKQWREPDRSGQFGLFALIWFATVLTFFTIAVTKYITYSLPSIPAAAILVALWWQQQMDQNKQSFWLKFSVYTSLIFSVVLGIGALYSPQWLMSDPAMPNLGRALGAAGLPMIGAIVWFGNAIAGLVLIFRRQMNWFWNVNFVAIAAFLVFFITPAFEIVDQERQLPLRQLAETVAHVRRDEAIVMATDSFEKPSLVFYTGQPVTFLNRTRAIQPYLAELRSSGAWHQSRPRSSSILMITTSKALQAAIPSGQYDLIQAAGVYQLVRVPIQ
ncbi:MAG: glycosyltransferase family 39 protein [Myxacorys chilensis ATA2-1-KO14]|nr:glycosyltransferase family 39 protein [Myxacorys chilensis ATA2-1-KO14]